jgi:hypothetical protein
MMEKLSKTELIEAHQRDFMKLYDGIINLFDVFPSTIPLAIGLKDLLKKAQQSPLYNKGLTKE